MRPFLLSVLICLLYSTLCAQGRRGQGQLPPAERAARQAARLQTALGLDASQRQAVEGICLESVQLMAQCNSDYSGNRRTWFACMRQVRQSRDGKLAQVLTPAQQQQYEQLKQQARQQLRNARQQGGHGRGGGMGRGQRRMHNAAPADTSTTTDPAALDWLDGGFGGSLDAGN